MSLIFQWTEPPTCAECRYHRKDHIVHDMFWPDRTVPHWCAWKERKIPDVRDAATCKNYLARIFG